jgi:CRISPR-associated protein (TIGR02584 family)
MPRWREVLIVTGGVTPQVVTETIYALATRHNDPIVPSKIICVVTKGVVGRFGAELETALSGLQRQLGLTADWDRRERAWHTGLKGLYLELPTDGSRAIDDIRSEIDAVRFGDLMSAIVRTETAHHDSRVHLSLAGGRKTMSFYGGAAMSLFGRPQDELSHILVHPTDFEGCVDYWHPTPWPHAVRHRDGRQLDANNATVELALIPYLRVRNNLPEIILSRDLDYSSYVAQINALLDPSQLSIKLVTATRSIHVSGITELVLSNQEFALYQLMSEWRLKGHVTEMLAHRQDYCGWLSFAMFAFPERYRPNPIRRYIEIYAETFKTNTQLADTIHQVLNPHPGDQGVRDSNKKSVGQIKSKMERSIRGQLQSSELAARIGAPERPVKVGKHFIFGVGLKSEQINICPE